MQKSKGLKTEESHISTQNKNDQTINKLKVLLVDISNKNEDLNKDNLDLNKKILSLITLLKIKDLQLKKMIIEVILKKRHIRSMMYLRKSFNKIRCHYIQRNQKDNTSISIARVESISLNVQKNERHNQTNRYFIRNEESIQYEGKTHKVNLNKELIEDFCYLSNQMRRTELFKENKIGFEIKPKANKREPHLQSSKIQQLKKFIDNNNNEEIEINSESNSNCNISIVRHETEIEYCRKRNDEMIYAKPTKPKMISSCWNNKLAIVSELNQSFILMSKQVKGRGTVNNNINTFKNVSPALCHSLSIIMNKPQSKEDDLLLNRQLSISSIPYIQYISLNNSSQKNKIESKQTNTLLLSSNILSLVLKHSYLNKINYFLKKLKYKSFSSQMLFGMKICKQLLIRSKLMTIIKSSYSKGLLISFNNFKSQIYINLASTQNEKIHNLTLLLNNQSSELEEAHNSNNLLKTQMGTFQSKFNQYDQSNKLKIKQTESKYTSTINQLKKDFTEKSDQYDKLKKLSSDSAIELINSSNVNTQQQLEIKQLHSDNRELAKSLEMLSSQLTTKEQILNKLNIQMEALRKEIQINESKQSNDSKNSKVKISNYQNEIEKNETQITNLLKENKKLQMTLEELSESNEHYDKMINESKGAKNENFSLKEKVAQYGNINKSMTIKYNKLKEEYEELKFLSEESKKDLSKALNEMQGYSSLLHLMQQKMEDSEQAKLAAENERDNAKNEIKTIRQRYINIIGEDKLK